jgi:hypothetical protein
LVYCNLALRADPGNQTATNLKEEMVKRALAQAEDWIQRGKFDAARLHYASMDDLAARDSAFPYPREDFRRELAKLEFTSYRVTHDHRFGSCSGTLKFNGYVVSYVPSGDSVDGFIGDLNSIIIASEESKRLRIDSRDKIFRFKTEDGASIDSVYQELVARVANERSTLASRNSEAPRP